ncbi:PREDICTED: interaptin-like isoform X1 [Amphimedon queenslandica]|uniref:Uncharacterized protein n=1 Tax=Amphimedon queenslandica TaxID=400682 RepID=A0AAN0JNY8_AMPQE|nr:PREDICTED: interaptin-like isoform X1 [Amphimedon queenslandica]|eukprot:XP_019858530.1 PREDICTED: interaptin-like isoform X1 [Amphimedon queenslandica]
MAAESPGKGQSIDYEYQPVKRDGHCVIRVGDYLYMWGGKQPDFPEVHNNEKKKSLCSIMEVCHLVTGRWEQKPTTGNPPLGVVGYAAAAIGNEIFYFGGYCNHVNCFHNSLYSFCVDTFNWKELSPTTSCHGPVMKWRCAMIAIKVNSEDYLVVIGGSGPPYNNAPEQPGAQYSRWYNNEIHFYEVSSGDWILPTVTEDRPPPIDSFTLTSINNSSAIFFGGETANGFSNNVYIVNFTDTSVNFSKLFNPGGSVQWPKERRAHSSVLINSSSGPHLLVVGGSNHDLWIFDFKNKSWKELFNVPDSVTDRYDHSLSILSVTPTTNWIVVFGGFTSYTDTAVIELRYTSNSDWSTSIIRLDQYKEKLQERRREWEASQSVQPEDRREIDRLMHVLQELEKELQEERRENEQVITTLQQQLLGREQQLQQAQQQREERERQIQDLQQQLQERERESEQQRQKSEWEVELGKEREQDLQRQLREQDQHLQQAQQHEQERERELQQARKIEINALEREQDLQRQLREREQQLQWEIQQGAEREQGLQGQLLQAQQQLQETQERERGLEQQLRERARHSTNATTSSSANVVHDSTSVSSTEGARSSATVDVNKVKKVINNVLVFHYADLSSLNTSLLNLASQLFAAGLISDEVRETRSMEKFITEFKASLNFKRKLPKVQEHCQKFLNSFIAVRGSYADAAEALGEDWIEAIRNELGFDFNIEIDVR